MLGAGRSCALPMRVPNCSPVLIKNLAHPWVQELEPVLGLGSGGRLLEHCQTPVPQKENLSLRKEHKETLLGPDISK